MNKEDYMHIALNLAKEAASKDEVPVGAIIINPQTAEIISTAYNQSAHTGDATDHAEIIAIKKACKILQSNRLWNLDMYVTLEPCTMCTAAISFARIRNVYFGAYDEKGGAIENGVKFYTSQTCHHKPHTEGGILQEECSAILKDFFQNKRQKKIPT